PSFRHSNNILPAEVYTSADGNNDDIWARLHKGGPSGLVSVLTMLGWWGRGGSTDPNWKAATIDIRRVLECMTAASMKRAGEDLEQDSARKRVACIKQYETMGLINEMKAAHWGCEVGVMHDKRPGGIRRLLRPANGQGRGYNASSKRDKERAGVMHDGRPANDQGNGRNASAKWNEKRRNEGGWAWHMMTVRGGDVGEKEWCISQAE
ncbi:hypothetical protein BD779DRAFT_1476967, partial [Infundibulicybe gibba]